GPRPLELHAVAQAEIVGGLAAEPQLRRPPLVDRERQAVLGAEVISELERAMQHERRADRPPQGIIGHGRAAVVAAGKADIAEERASVEERPGQAGIAAIARDPVRAQSELRPWREEEMEDAVVGRAEGDLEIIRAARRLQPAGIVEQEIEVELRDRRTAAHQGAAIDIELCRLPSGE